MKMPEFKAIEFKLPNLPKPVAISVAVIVGSIVTFLLLIATLGAARDDAELDVSRLKAEVSSNQSKVRKAREDYEYVLKNQGSFDALMSSDKLIPHTRRTAIREMQALAMEFGLTTLNYNFQAAGVQSPTGAASQPKSGEYQVTVETIELTVGAPLDGPIYSFMAAVHDHFPGSMVVSSFEMLRPPRIMPDMLNNVSRGEESKIIQGKLYFSWRTAQKQEGKK